MHRRGSLFWLSTYVVVLLTMTAFSLAVWSAHPSMTYKGLLLIYGRQYLVFLIMLALSVYMVGDGQ